MARQISFVLILIVFSAAGCQQNSIIANLPAPNFGGPLVAAPPPVVPAPVVVAPQPKAIARPSVDQAWIPDAPRREWRWIVIHHSATPSGSAARFDREHRQKWDELGYHFVIGNGTETGNGQVEVGSRWGKQKWGAHAKTEDNRFNDYGIGICLVGNFEIERPTQQQLQSLAKLTSYLMQTYHIPPGNIIGHADAHGTPTACPGHNLSVAVVKQMATKMLADAGETVTPDSPDAQVAAGTELLTDLRN